MGNTNTILNAHRNKLRQEGKNLLDEYVATTADLPDGEREEAIRKKAAELLLSHPIPDILMIKLEDFVAHGAFPRCPDNRNLTCTLQSIDRDNSLLIFISHCWMRGYSGAEGWDGRPHPDNAKGDKYDLCVKALTKVRKFLAPKMKNCYVWLDFGCINQDGNPAGELEQLDKIIEACDCIFTPIVDNPNTWTMGTITDWYSDYKAKLWNDGPHAYLNRGWCRVEMLYAANIPVLQNENVEIKRHTLLESGLASNCEANRRPHLLYGHREVVEDILPHMLPPLQNTMLEKYHPLNGSLSVESDKKHIEALVVDLQPYIDAHKAKPGYQGEYNAKGQKHGVGKLISASGDVYEGQWEYDTRHGKGIYRYADGNVYEGDFWNGQKEGHGIWRYANGSVYEGGYKAGDMNGFGTYRWADGDVYEGEYHNDKRHGHGIFRYTNGDVFEGKWIVGGRNGLGTNKFANGDVYVGQYRFGKHLGQGIMTYANGDVYDGLWEDNLRHGRGVMKYANGEVFDGDWKEGEKVEVGVDVSVVE